MPLTLSQLSDRIVPAVVDVTGGVLTFTDAGSENNNLTVATSGGVYAFSDSASIITLGSGATGAGWKGDGTKSVSGPATSVDGIEIYAGGGTNTINVKSILDPIAINGESGTTTINITSTAPLTSGNLNGIQGAVTVNAGDATTLNVSDYTGTSRAGVVGISATAITNLAPQTITLSGTFASLTVRGSNNVSLAESYVVDAPDAVNFQLFTNGGVDDVEVVAWNAGCTGTFNGGGGTADSLTILDGIMVYGTAVNFEVNDYNTLGFGELV